MYDPPINPPEWDADAKLWHLGPLDKNDQRTVNDGFGQLVAVVCHECLLSRIPEMEANARLIVAAPMMLEALKKVVLFLHQMPPMEISPLGTCLYAIGKAEGR